MGTGQRQGGFNVPNGGIGSLVPQLGPSVEALMRGPGMGGPMGGQMGFGQMSPGMGDRLQPMPGAFQPPGSQMALPGTPGQTPMTQQQAMQSVMGMQPQTLSIMPGPMVGSQMAIPAAPGMTPGAQPLPGTPGQTPMTQQQAMQFGAPPSMFGSMTGQTPNPTQNQFSFMGQQPMMGQPSMVRPQFGAPQSAQMAGGLGALRLGTPSFSRPRPMGGGRDR
jgi:hypothetical protein